MAWGGHRVGAGRKPADARRLALAGGKRRSKRRSAPVSVSAPSAVLRPADLDVESAVVWAELAPKATARQTLTETELPGFLLLCQNVALERRMRRAELGAGVGGPDHRGMIRLVEIGLARFGLTGTGKPATMVEAPKDEWAEFDGPQLVKGARA